MSESFFWISLNFLSLIVLSFYSMMEMAVVSFSKIRLQYYVSKGDSRARKLAWLLENSSRLFGTTLIGVNVALMFGSEFSRLSYESIGLSPDLAPLTQVMIVIIFGELAPMFAARRFSEHTAMIGVQLLYASAILMKPFLFLIELITHAAHALFGGKSESFDLYLNQDEIRKILEEHHEDKPVAGSTEELNAIISNIFELRKKTALKIMRPLSALVMVPSNAQVRKLRQAMLSTLEPFILVYHQKTSSIVGVAFPRDFIRAPDTKRVDDYTSPPWFIPGKMEAVHILQEFKMGHHALAIVQSDKGEAIGAITLQDVVDEIFGHGTASFAPLQKGKLTPLIERTFPGTMTVKEFNSLYGVQLAEAEHETLAELMTRIIGHTPIEGETISLPPFDLEVKESSLLDVKLVSIKTKTYYS